MPVSRKQKLPADTGDRPGNLIALTLLAPIVGAAAGLVGALFRLALGEADRMRDDLIGWARGEQLLGFLTVACACAATTLVAASQFAGSRRLRREAASLTWRRC